ncbi:MAG: PKD domain-containing protein [Myxococcales bacterium]|nr:PKD domain-containing protein [Myxococcales bacterium]
MWSTLLLISAAHAVQLDFTCSDDDGFLVGVAPFEVTCVLDEPSQGTWTDVVWLMGDGTVGDGASFTYTYEESGQFSVSVFLEGYVDPDDPDADDSPGRRKAGLISVCGAPSPSFTYVDKGGRSYQMENLTDVSAPRCIDDISWAVFRGENRERDPILVADGWEPRLDIPEDGQYTIELTVSGVGGVSTAVTELDAKYGLTEELREHYAGNCSTAAGGGGGLASLLGLLLVSARRRRSRS